MRKQRAEEKTNKRVLVSSSTSPTSKIINKRKRKQKYESKIHFHVLLRLT